MCEFLIKSEMEEKNRKLMNDILLRKLELLSLRKELDFLPRNCQDRSSIDVRQMGGQSPPSKTTQSTSHESVGMGSSMRRNRRYDSNKIGAHDDLESLGMAGTIPDLPESPQLWPSDVPYREASKVKRDHVEFPEDSLEVCNFNELGISKAVQNTAETSSLAVQKGKSINVQATNKVDNTIEDQKFNAELFKTEICRSWRKFGACIYGDSCHFAHGVSELRVRPKPHRNYKTEMCKKFLAGYCPYGPRCCFVHNPNEQYESMNGGHIANRSLACLAYSKENRDMIRRWHR